MIFDDDYTDEEMAIMVKNEKLLEDAHDMEEEKLFKEIEEFEVE